MKRERKKIENSNTSEKTIIVGAKPIINQKISIKTKISNKLIFIAVIIISIPTLIAFYPAFDNELTNWDDDSYVTKNPFLKEINSETLKGMFSTYVMGNYHPLAMLSLSVDYVIAGEKSDGTINPFIFHFTNILLHLLITLLVFWFLIEMFGNYKIALIAALFFGIHAIHVESVAWVSERKDVLYTFFFFASLISYVKYIDVKKNYLLFFSFLLFILALLSKAQAVSLAVTLIAIDLYKNKSYKNTRVILEKIPFFIAAVIFGIYAVRAQQDGNAIVSTESYSFVQRIGFAGYAFMQYIIELILPLKLSAMNPYPDIINQTMPAYYWLFLIPSVAIAFALFYTYKRNKIIAFSIAFFIINIFLLLQLLPVGSAVHADRYAYIPSVGFFILLGYFVNYLQEKQKISNTIIYPFLGGYAIVMIFLTMNQCEIWKNSETLWDDTLEKSPKAVVAWNNRGGIYDFKAKEFLESGDYQESEKLRRKAIYYFDEAIRQKPDYSTAFYNRGMSSIELAKMINDTSLANKSIKDFTSALNYDPGFPEAYNSRGNAYDFLNILDNAISDFNQAIDLKPTDADFYSNRGVTYGKLGKLKESIENFDKSIEINPKNGSAYSNRGYAKMLSGDYKAALLDLDISVQIKKDSKSLYNRALAKQNLNDIDGAIIDAGDALIIDENFADAFYVRGLNYLKKGKKEQACADFQEAAKKGNPYAASQININCK